MKRYNHSLSHYNLQTTNMGVLTPVGNMEVIPGTTHQHRTSALIRMAPQAAPVMHPITARFHNWYCPTRIMWGEEFGDTGSFEDFITGGKNNDDTQTVPKITIDFTAAGTPHTGSLACLLGVPNADGLQVSALDFRAFWLTYEQYYADQDLVDIPDWRDPTVLEQLAHQKPPRVAWSKDYFTTARPWTQKGPSISIPIGNSAPIKMNAAGGGTQNIVAFNDQTDTPYTVRHDGISATPVYLSGSQDAGQNLAFADLSSSSGIDVNEFRKFMALQRYSEARAQYGSRYTEYLQYLGINPSDARLQRVEYLGGSKQTIQISEVLQQSPNVTDLSESNGYGMGDMYGHGVGAVRSKRIRKYFEEHGIVLSLMSVIPMPMYQNGVSRHMLKTHKEDFFTKELSQIGQQPIFNAEVYADGTAADLETFGFNDRYGEYKHHYSGIRGEFRTTLNYWHMAQDYETRPVLNGEFVTCTPTDRTFNVETGDKLWTMVNHSIQQKSMVPKSSKSRIL